MAHTRGFKGVETHRFPDSGRETDSAKRKAEKRTLPVLLYSWSVAVFFFFCYRLLINFMTRMSSWNPPVYKAGSTSAMRSVMESRYCSMRACSCSDSRFKMPSDWFINRRVFSYSARVRTDFISCTRI